MASSVAHFLVGSSLALPVLRTRQVTTPFLRWFTIASAGILAVAPDFDLAGRRLFGVTRASLFSHRGFYHSPFFLIVACAVLALLFARIARPKAFLLTWIVWAGCAVTHPILDSMTDGGRGVMLLLPFDQARIFLPWRPIYTPPTGAANVFERAFILRQSEIPFCLAALALGGTGLWVRIRPRKSPAQIREESTV